MHTATDKQALYIKDLIWKKGERNAAIFGYLGTYGVPQNIELSHLLIIYPFDDKFGIVVSFLRPDLFLRKTIFATRAYLKNI